MEFKAVQKCVPKNIFCFGETSYDELGQTSIELEL